MVGTAFVEREAQSGVRKHTTGWETGQRAEVTHGCLAKEQGWVCFVAHRKGLFPIYTDTLWPAGGPAPVLREQAWLERGWEAESTFRYLYEAQPCHLTIQDNSH